MHFFKIEKEKNESEKNSSTHSHDFYEIYIQKSGQRTCFYNNARFDVGIGNIIVFKPDIQHELTGGPYERYIVSIPLNAISTLQKEYLDILADKITVHLHPSSWNKVFNCLDRLLYAYNSMNKDKFLSMNIEFGYFLYCVHKNSISAVVSSINLNTEQFFPSAHLILKLKNYIQENYNKPLSLSTMSKLFNVSKTWMCHCFLSSNGCTIFEYKNHLQIENAKYLLINTKYSIKKIASLIGFSSSTYFSTSFKKSMAISPLQFRRLYFKKSKR